MILLTFDNFVINSLDEITKYAQNETVLSLNSNDYIKRKDIIVIHKDKFNIYTISHKALDSNTLMDMRLISNGLNAKNIVLNISDYNLIKSHMDDLNRSSIKYQKLDTTIELFNFEKSDVPKEREIVNLLNHVFEKAIIINASDIHIEPLDKIIRFRYRIDGDLKTEFTIPSSNLDMIVSRIKILSKLNIAEKRIPQDGRITFIYENRDIDMRISTIPTIRGEKVVIRIFDSHFKINEIEDLGIESSDFKLLEKLISIPNGLILLCGPTGCGKSTTIYTILQALNDESVNITTIEDPVEYRISGLNQIQIKPAIGLDFDNALAHILRQDPEIIFVGELRTEITAQTAMRAALTGHKVFSTIHTYNALSAIDRLRDMGIEPYLISSGINGIISQRLVKKLCPRCRVKVEEYNPIFKSRWHFIPKGCENCNQGYLGRTAIYEILVLDKKLKRAIAENRTSEELFKIAYENGFIEMKNKLSNILESGISSERELMNVLNSLE